MMREPMINEAVEQSALIEAACHDLLTYGVWDWKKKLKRLIKKYVLGRPAQAEDLIFWPTGLLAAGLWDRRQKILQEAAETAAQRLRKPGADTVQIFPGVGTDATLKTQAEAAQILSETGVDAAQILSETGVDAAQRPQDAQTGTAQLFSGAGKAGETIKRIDAALCAYYGRWMKKSSAVACLDDLLAGETLLSIYEEHQKNSAKEQKDTASEQGNSEWGEVISVLNKDRLSYTIAMEGLVQCARYHVVDETGSFPYREKNESKLVLVDTIGQACPFLYRYGQMPEKEYAMEVAVKQIVNFLAYGMDAATGLPYHGYVVADACKYGIIGWGRGVGWLLRGMTGCMTTLYGAEKLGDSFKELADTVLGYQRRDGYFSWQLQAMDGPADTSATGLICVALKKGLEFGMLEGEQYELALLAGQQAIERSVKNGRVYDCSGECEGPGQYPQRYGAYPWALGPALMLDLDLGKVTV